MFNLRIVSGSLFLDGLASEEVEPKSSLLTLGIVCGVLCCLIVLGALMIFIISRFNLLLFFIVHSAYDLFVSSGIVLFSAYLVIMKIC